VEDTLDIVRGAGLRPRDIRLEITEGIALDIQGGRSDVIRRFTDAGTGVQIDDFGTGYSALSRLQSLAFDTLKIDRGFVAQLAESEESLEVVRMIVTMARTLGMSVIAEGVETDDQRQQLQGLDCRQGQGYLFSEPLDGDGVDALLAEQS
jgi:EAL domain-containing protein (putative c-di-GMP-specific phosphodiesterase class I)